MRIANVQRRACFVVPEGFVDINVASEGRFSSEVREVVADMASLRAWYDTLGLLDPDDDELAALETDERLGCVVDGPRQVFAIGLNYRAHAAEMGLANPTLPMVFTKFPSCLAGQHAEVPVVSATTDWEAELVVVIGTGGRDVPLNSALDVVAGFAVGQDVSDRTLQMSGSPAQFSLGKSWKNFGPIGPWITTLEHLTDVHDLGITCAINGTTHQDSRTSDMVFSAAEVVSYLSSVVELFPGDVIFTGSPFGVGQGLHPQQFLQPGDEIVTSIESLGTLRNYAVAPGGRAGEI